MMKMEKCRKTHVGNCRTVIHHSEEKMAVSTLGICCIVTEMISSDDEYFPNSVYFSGETRKSGPFIELTRS